MNFPLQRIIVPVDLTEDEQPTAARHALNAAVGLAKPFDATIVLVTVVPEHADAAAAGLSHSTAAFKVLKQILDERVDQLTKRLNALAATAGAHDVPTETIVRSPSRSIGETIVDVAKEQSAELIVMCSHQRRGLGRLLLGSVAERVTQTAETPVLLLRSPNIAR